MIKTLIIAGTIGATVWLICFMLGWALKKAGKGNQK